MNEINILCGGVDTPKQMPNDSIIRLDVQGDNKSVELKIESISEAVLKNIPDAVFDMLEIAAYVYCADQQIRRGSEFLTDYGKDWRRLMNFIIPVRNLKLWSSAELRENLEETLGFLAGEPYSFKFVQAENPVTQATPYFEFSDDPSTPDEVALFSGGVDSFAGAVESIVDRKRKVALVGHHSANKVKNVQKTLIDGLKDKGYEKQLQYISIKVHNFNATAPEYTQRTRSFLFACLGMTIAKLYGKDEFSFYENGTVSLNLPITKDVLGSRATRTTHPKVINGFIRIFSTVFDKEINVKHPYQWLTKSEVTQKIAKYDCHDLLEETNSCTRPRTWTKTKNHCGVCSQCIDRRFGILAANLAEHDSADKYNIDLLTGYRNEKGEINMAANYVKFARDFKNLTKERFVTDHPQIASALAEFPDLTSAEAEDKIFDLYKRHSDDVMNVMEQGLEEHKERVVDGTLPSTSLLSVLFNRSETIDFQTADTENQMKGFLDNLDKQPCRFYFDSTNKRLLFKGNYEVKGANYKLVEALINNFREGKKSDSDDIACIYSGTLASTLQIDDTTLRQTIRRFRNELSQRLGADQGIVFDTDGFIENLQGKGYRLNSNLIEVMSASDLGDN